jgi:CBS domain-containing protein
MNELDSQDQSETNQDGNVAHHMISTMMNDAAHDVRSLISTGAPLLCPDTASVREAASRMYNARKTAILVFSEETVTDDNNDDVGEVEAAGGVTSSGKVCGILTTKDILSRVVAKGLDANATVVSTVMTPEPDTIPLECSLIDALHVMLDGRYLHIPVEDKGKVCGVLDVLDCAVAMFGPSLKNKRAHTSNAAAALNDPQQGGGDGGDMTEFADLLFDTAPHSSSASAAGAHDADSLSQYSGAGAFTAQQQQLYPVTRGRRDSASVSSSRQQQQKQQQRGRGPSAQGRRMMIADGSALVVGQEGEDQVDESDLYGSGDDVQIVIKVRDMTRGGKLSRVHCDMFDYDSAVLAVLGAPSDEVSVCCVL